MIQIVALFMLEGLTQKIQRLQLRDSIILQSLESSTRYIAENNIKWCL